MAIASLGEIGSASGVLPGAAITIPVTVDVPRSDPTDGATIVLVLTITDNLSAPSTNAISDDAPTDAFYDTHIFADGLNHYITNVPLLGGVNTGVTVMVSAGLILNPLVASLNSITVPLGGTADNYVASARAYTGVLVDTDFDSGLWPGSPSDDCTSKPVSASFLNRFAPGGIKATAQDLDTLAEAKFAEWAIDSGGNSLSLPNSVLPYSFPGSDPDWQYENGDVALFGINAPNEAAADKSAMAWDDGAISTVFSVFSVPMVNSGGTVYANWVVGERAITGPTGALDFGSVWTGGSDLDEVGGGSFAMIAGVGPTWPTCPPSGVPVFGHRFRAVD